MQKTIAAFDIKDLLPIGLTIVVMGIGLGYGLSVLGTLKTDTLNDECDAANTTVGTDWNATSGRCEDSAGNWTFLSGSDEVAGYNATIEGVAKLPEKLPLIVTVIVAAVIIGILVRYLLIRFR